MLLNTDKTVVIHIRMQDTRYCIPYDARGGPREEAQGVCKFTCPHLNCGFKFRTKAGMVIHAGRCEWRNKFEVESIIDHRGPTIAGNTTYSGRITVTLGIQEETFTPIVLFELKMKYGEIIVGLITCTY